jgi:hypothetical protein
VLHVGVRVRVLKAINDGKVPHIVVLRNKEAVNLVHIRLDMKRWNYTGLDSLAQREKNRLDETDGEEKGGYICSSSRTYRVPSIILKPRLRSGWRIRCINSALKGGPKVKVGAIKQASKHATETCTANIAQYSTRRPECTKPITKQQRITAQYHLHGVLRSARRDDGGAGQGKGSSR